MSLLDDTRTLLLEAQASLAGTTAGAELATIIERLDGPLRVAIAGRVKAGKSTLLNALVGQPVAATDARECTRVVTWYRHGPTPAALALHKDGSTAALAIEHDERGRAAVVVHDAAIADLHAIHVFAPSAELTSLSLIDTPGVGSITLDAEARSTDFLGGSGGDTEADAVLYLLKHLDSSDLGLLSAFHDDAVSQPNPINAIGVLSRADEVGSGRPDAMQSAERVANRIAGVANVRRLVSTVVPVCGLLAETAATLTEADYELLANVAALPHDQRRAALLSADRFRSLAAAGELTAADCEHLLNRLAMFGLRTAVTAIAGGAAPTADDLARLLTRVSGIADVRSLLHSVFAERGDVLKARSALVGLDSSLRRLGTHPAVDGLARRLEQVVASAHEIQELRTLAALRLDPPDAPDELVAEAERLLGAGGQAPHRRLGLLETATHDQQLDAARHALKTWQHRAEHPLSSVELVSLCRIVIRSCEGLISELLAGSAPPESASDLGAP